MKVMNYDPNLVSCGRIAKQTVKLIFGVWKYRKTMEVIVNGNCCGFRVIDHSIDVVLDQLPKDDFDEKTIIMTDENGEVLESSFVDSDKCDEEEWLKEMLLSAEIISITKVKTRKKS